MRVFKPTSQKAINKMDENTTKNAQDNQAHQSCQSRLKANSILEIKSWKKKNAGMEINNNEKGNNQTTNRQRISKGTKGEDKIIERAYIRDGGKIRDIREKT